MIVDTMSADDIEREFNRDRFQLLPMVMRKKKYLAKALKRSGKDFYQMPSFYTVNRNQYVINYAAIKNEKVQTFDWHYISNTRQPYLMASMLDQTNERYYAKVDAHAILRFIERNPDYEPIDKMAFVKEAAVVTMDLIFPVRVNSHYVSPSGLWPLATDKPVNGILHVKTFIHKSMLNKRQREIYLEGLLGVEDEALILYAESLLEFVPKVE